MSTDTVTAFGRSMTPAAAHNRLAEIAALSATYGDSDDRVTEANAITTALRQREEQFAAAERIRTKPYVVYTRLYKKSGACEKRIHRFATRKAQQSFMSRTKRAVTFHN